MIIMKTEFILQKVTKTPIQGGRTEDEYHYASADGVHRTSFHAGKRPWTWIVTDRSTKMTLIQSDELVNEFCVQALQNSVS